MMNDIIVIFVFDVVIGLNILFKKIMFIGIWEVLILIDVYLLSLYNLN